MSLGELSAMRSVLAHELLQRLELLAVEDKVRGVKARLQDITNKLYLLERASGRTKQGSMQYEPGLIPSSELPRIEMLAEFWRGNSKLGGVVDEVFREMDLLTCEHVPEMLRQWARPKPEAPTVSTQGARTFPHDSNLPLQSTSDLHP